MKGILQDYLQLPATWVAKTILPPEKEHVSKKGTIPNGHFIFQQPSIFRGYTFVFRGVSLCMTLTGRLRYFLGQKPKRTHIQLSFARIIPKVVSIQSFHEKRLDVLNGLGYIGSSQPHWVQTFGRVFWKPQSGSELFFSQGKKLKMMEPKLAFSLTTHQLVTKVRVNAVFS